MNGEGSAARRWRTLPAIASALLLVIGGSALHRLSPTVDEFGYVQRGTAFWFHGRADWLIRAGANPLPFLIQNLPNAAYVKWTRAGLPLSDRQEMVDFGDAGLSVAEQRGMLYAARWVNLLLAGLGTIWAVWSVGCAFFGPRVGGIASLLAAVEPNLVAGAMLATSDAAVIPCALLLVKTYDRHLQAPTPGRAALAFGAFAIGVSLKLTMLPIGLLLMAAVFGTWLWHGQGHEGKAPARRDGPVMVGSSMRRLARPLARFALRHVLTFVLFSLPVCWALNGFLMGPLLEPLSPGERSAKLMRQVGLNDDAIERWQGRLRSTRVPMPIVTLRAQVAHSSGGHPMMYRGRIGLSGPWYYYPFVLVTKAHLLLLAAAAASLFLRPAWRSPILPGALLLVAFTCTMKMHGGPRYFLIIHALAALAGAVALDRLLATVAPDYAAAGGRKRARMAPLVLASSVLVAVSLLLTLSSWPDMLTHTSILFGGDSEGYRLAEANYDWGQGLYTAIDRANRLGFAPIVYLHSGDPNYGVPSSAKTVDVGLDPPKVLAALRGKYVAAGVNLLHGPPREMSTSGPIFRALAAMEPTVRLNRTFFVYDLTDAQRFKTFVDSVTASR